MSWNEEWRKATARTLAVRTFANKWQWQVMVELKLILKTFVTALL